MVGMRNSVCLQVLLLALFASSVPGDARSVKEAVNAGNFMEDKQWLSTISQYSRKIKHWNRFRDEVEDDYVRMLEDPQGSDENLDSIKNPCASMRCAYPRVCLPLDQERAICSNRTDTTKNPCTRVRCARHKVCVALDSQRAICINRKKVEQRVRQIDVKGRESSCKPCPITAATPVCGSDGHNYASQCKLEQQACLTGKELSLHCAGVCPCATTSSLLTDTPSQHQTCTAQDLSDLGDRLRDWFQLLHGNAKQNSSEKPGPELDRGPVASCKDSIGWMFSRLDANGDLDVDRAELSAVNLEKYEVCIRPFFSSCDGNADGQLSTAEWCLCFWREKPPCLAEVERIQMQEGSKRKPGLYIPRCDEDGFYRRLQCDKAHAECWCVDQQGVEVIGSRIHGNPDCDELVGSSGDFGSSVGWEDEEEREGEENAEEAEEEGEESEPGEVDDGGYIW